ncbi:DUF1775 domain-containing protein [Streptomyces sp. SS7]|uniref:DUF1775 domain-containing protein n=1 Tax=Streptomyces sp. SS7 TaxID=3108485 RepID=UPI0030EE5499
MPLYPHARPFGRVPLAGALALTATLSLAQPASAHTEIEADTPTALARDVTLTFTYEAESDTAGFTQVRVVLPDGIEPDDVTLEHAPRGWKFTAAPDGYTIVGPALATGADAEHAISVRRLPNAEEIVFRTVDTYADGKVARWVELPTQEAESDQPAPVLKLKPADEGAKPADSPSARKADAASADLASGASADTSALAENEGLPAQLTTAGAAAVLVALGAVAWRLKRRRAGGGGAR